MITTNNANARIAMSIIAQFGREELLDPGIHVLAFTEVLSTGSSNEDPEELQAVTHFWFER